MSDKPVRVPVSELVEWNMRQQREHYDRLFSDGVARVEDMPLSEEDKRALIEEHRAFLDADLDRCARELSAYVASGLRLPDESLH